MSSYRVAVSQHSPGSRYSAHPGKRRPPDHQPCKGCTTSHACCTTLAGLNLQRGLLPRVRGVPRPGAMLCNAFSVETRTDSNFCKYNCPPTGATKRVTIEQSRPAILPLVFISSPPTPLPGVPGRTFAAAYLTTGLCRKLQGNFAGFVVILRFGMHLQGRTMSLPAQ